MQLHRTSVGYIKQKGQIAPSCIKHGSEIDVFVNYKRVSEPKTVN